MSDPEREYSDMQEYIDALEYSYESLQSTISDEHLTNIKNVIDEFNSYTSICLIEFKDLLDKEEEYP